MPVTLMPYAAANPPLEVDLSPLQQPPDRHLHHQCTLCSSNLSPHNSALIALDHLSSLGSLDTPPTMSSTDNDLSSPDDTTNPGTPAPEPVFYSLDRIPAHRRRTAIPAKKTSKQKKQHHFSIHHNAPQLKKYLDLVHTGLESTATKVIWGSARNIIL
jgi:hypothetical protein